MNTNEISTEKQATEAKAKSCSRSPKAYVAPRIVTHSAQQLEKASLAVNACTSYIP